MKKILILCTGNSCRSQIAHGFLETQLKGKAEIFSAGIETHGVNPSAIKAMAEKDIDISGHSSNRIDEYQDVSFDFVITVCDHAKENCPYLPSKGVSLHHNFSDPAKVRGSKSEIMDAFRQVRDEIEEYCMSFCKQYFTN